VTFLVGLTGGIGSGKSTVARRLEELGATVVDTDEISHQLTAPGGAAIPTIKREFGDDFLRPDGSLDRDRMRTRVFSDAASRRRLEAILHPLIRRMARSQVQRGSGPYAVLVVPLLMETGAYREFIQRILVVDCPVEDQIERTMRRSKLSRPQVESIIAAQIGREERLAQADDVIDNGGSPERALAQVELLHCRYVELAAAARP
jgi:dephospho-CoA kinase